MSLIIANNRGHLYSCTWLTMGLGPSVATKLWVKLQFRGMELYIEIKSINCEWIYLPGNFRPSSLNTYFSSHLHCILMNTSLHNYGKPLTQDNVHGGVGGPRAKLTHHDEMLYRDVYKIFSKRIFRANFYIVSCSLLWRKVHESKLKRQHVTYSPTSSVFPVSDGTPWNQEFKELTRGRWRNGQWEHSVSMMSY